MTRMILGAALTMLVVWVVLLLLVVALGPKDVNLGEIRRFVPDLVGLLRRLRAEVATSRAGRVVIGAVVVYLVSPVDLVPDFLPVIGYADDVILALAVLRWMLRRAGPEVVAACWPGTERGLAAVMRVAARSGKGSGPAKSHRSCTARPTSGPKPGAEPTGGSLPGARGSTMSEG